MKVPERLGSRIDKVYWALRSISLFDLVVRSDATKLSIVPQA